jgi:tight adherence protein B
VIIVFAALALGIATWWGLRMRQQARLRAERIDAEGDIPSDVARAPASGLTDYTRYRMSWREKLVHVLFSAAVLFIVGYVFYRNALIALVLSAASLYYPVIRAAKLKEKRQRELTLQFRQALASLSSALVAGKSLENAFRDAAADLALLYPDPQTDIIRELEAINRQVDNGVPIEKALLNFAGRSGVEDIRQFADVLVTCKRTGGNLVSVVRRTSDIIGDKLEIEQEISVLIAQKRFESKVLAFAPIVVVAALSFSSPDYMAPLYSGPGYLIMTSALTVLIFCYWMIQKIMDMKV